MSLSCKEVGRRDSKKYVLEFNINRLPKMTNRISRAHWAVKTREASDFRQLVHDAVRLRKPPQALKRANLFLLRCSAQEPDFDGLVSGFKHVIDGLVSSGVLINDKSSNINPTYRWEKAKKNKGLIRVKVEEVSE